MKTVAMSESILSEEKGRDESSKIVATDSTVVAFFLRSPHCIWLKWWSFHIVFERFARGRRSKDLTRFCFEAALFSASMLKSL